jgi:hypothetical protein
MFLLSTQVLILIAVIFGATALALSCIGIGTPNWQTTSINTTIGEMRITNTANFFYACRLNLIGEVLSCGDRSTNSNIALYYKITTTGNETDWNLHLNTAAGFSIMGIIFIFLGTIATLSMFYADRGEWILLVAPTFLFVACLFMLTGLAEGSRVLQYNGYSANLYETAHLLTIFSFLVSAIIAGRLFRPPLQSQPSRKTRVDRIYHY